MKNTIEELAQHWPLCRDWKEVEGKGIYNNRDNMGEGRKTFIKSSGNKTKGLKTELKSHCRAAKVKVKVLVHNSARVARQQRVPNSKRGRPFI